MGATNAGRLLGRRYFYLILFLDGLKGALAVALGLSLAGPAWLPEACGLAAVAGHIFPVFLRFRGGKAVATACGIFAVLAPLATALAAIVFVSLVRLSHYISVGSVAAAIVLPVSAYWLYLQPDAPAWARPSVTTVWLAAMVGLAVLALHYKNIIRLLRGEESRF